MSDVFVPNYFGYPDSLGFNSFSYIPQFNPTFTSSFGYPQMFNFTGSSSGGGDELSIRELNAQADKQIAETQQAAAAASHQKWKDAPLAPGERKTLLPILDEEAKKAEPGIAPALASSAVIGGVGMAKKSSDPVLRMMYNKNNIEMHNLFETHPDLMTRAQDALRKLERGYERDLRCAVNNTVLTNEIKRERFALRKQMIKAMQDGDVNRIADLTAKMECANGTKNGWLARTWRRMRGGPRLLSREGTVVAAEQAGKLKVKPPKAGTSFWRNIGGKAGGLGAATMLVGGFLMDKDKIAAGYAIDKETGNKQLMQTATKSVAGTAAFCAADAAAKTVVKKSLGKIAAKVATKIAIKGGCKLLGSAIGSIVPGVGTAIGFIVGCVADFAISKLFSSSAAEEKRNEKMTDEELLDSISYSFMNGAEINDEQMAVLKRKYDDQTILEMTRIRNLPEEERKQFFEQAQAEAQAEAAQPQIKHDF